MVTGLGVCVAWLSLGAPVVAQEDPLDRPFAQPMYLVHITGTGTTSGPTTRDDYILSPVPPQNGILVTPDGMGGTYTNSAEMLAGPFYTLREVCANVGGWGPRAQALGCPAPTPTPTLEPSITLTPNVPVTTAEEPIPDPREQQNFFDRVAEWWNGLDTTRKLVVIGLVGGFLYVISLIAGPIKFRGKMSTFGGPNDSDPDTKLALIGKHNAQEFSEFFRSNPPDTSDLFHDLNPEKFYIACRWNYQVTPQDVLRRSFVKVTNPQNGKTAQAKPVDWGPGKKTGRVADLSPGLANFLDLNTDDEVEVILER